MKGHRSDYQAYVCTYERDSERTKRDIGRCPFIEDDMENDTFYKFIELGCIECMKA